MSREKNKTTPRAFLIARNIAVIWLVALVFFAWGVATLQYGVFPWKIWDKVHSFFADENHKTLSERLILDHQEYGSHFDFAGFKVRDPDFHDDGYVLISRYSKEHGQTIAQLFSISKRKTIHTWIPPLPEIFRRTPKFSGRGINTRRAYRTQHPLLLPDGDILFTSGEGPLVRLDACGNIVWTVERHFHHSIELDPDGNIVVPIVLDPPVARTVFPIRDDGFAVVSLQGKILREYSMTQLLLKNGFRGLVYGVGPFEKDRIHLNDAQPMLKETPGVEIGDIGLSMRHLSSIALFRPPSGKLIWVKTGPWLAQHDVNQLDDGGFSVFGNDIIRKRTRKKSLPVKKSDVYVYRPFQDAVARPYSKILSEVNFFSSTAGRARILENGDVFVEETNRGRLLRLSAGKVRWEWVNAVSPDTVGALHWSRYIASNEIDLEWKENPPCR